MNTYISEFTLSSVQPRRMAKLTGVTKVGKGFNEVYIFVIAGVLIGVFATVVVLRPDLINWEVFGRSFTNGLIYGAIMR